MAIYCDTGLQLVDLVLLALSAVQHERDKRRISDVEDALDVYNAHAAGCELCCRHAPVRLAPRFCDVGMSVGTLDAL